MNMIVHGASFSLSAAMVEVLSYCRSLAKAYYNDCIIFSKGRSPHLAYFKKLLEKFSLYGLHINLLKRQFMKSNIVFLGHILSGQWISPEVVRLRGCEFFTPTCASEDKSFLEMASFLRKFVPDFSLHLLKKDKEFVWAVVCQKRFDDVKVKLKPPERLILCLIGLLLYSLTPLGSCWLNNRVITCTLLCSEVVFCLTLRDDMLQVTSN